MALPSDITRTRDCSLWQEGLNTDGSTLTVTNSCGYRIILLPSYNTAPCLQTAFWQQICFLILHCSDPYTKTWKPLKKKQRLTISSASGLAALSLSLRISCSIDSLMAILQALWQISVKSAPLKPCVFLAKKSRSMSWNKKQCKCYNWCYICL